MMLYLYNTATRQKEEFHPLNPGQVKMYVCGPTVYDFFHIGNARAFVVFDTLRRVLEHFGYEVKYVQNITDVDDKIIKRANQEGRTAEEVAKEFTDAFLQDAQALGCKPATLQPKATEHMTEIIDLVKRLVAGGHAYAMENGDVYFSVRTFTGYGKISGKNIEELEQGARVEVDERKQDPLDFALWKSAKPNEPAWDSPWGKGRPGWHMECSAMSMKYLGDSFDIHGGGEDLVFPHHENENAQSESLTGKPLARYWLHNGFLKIDGEKMSKSLENFRVIRDILKHYPYQVLRLFMLSAHYRSPLDFFQENLDAAKKGYEEFWRNTVGVLLYIIKNKQKIELMDIDDDFTLALEKHRQELLQAFDEALANDFNTAEALGHLMKLAGHTRDLIAHKNDLTQRRYGLFDQILKDLVKMSDLFGIREEKIRIPDEEVKGIINARDADRLLKKWSDADAKRQDLYWRKGWEIKDTAFGTLASATAEAFFNKEGIMDGFIEIRTSDYLD